MVDAEAALEPSHSGPFVPLALSPTSDGGGGASRGEGGGGLRVYCIALRRLRQVVRTARRHLQGFVAPSRVRGVRGVAAEQALAVAAVRRSAVTAMFGAQVTAVSTQL